MTQQTLTPRTSASIPSLVQGVITISEMPKRFRLDVEQLFVEYLPSPAPSEDYRDFAAIDALSVDAEWFTQWRRNRNNPGTVSCRQTLSADPVELDALEDALVKFAVEQGFRASVRRFESF